MKTPTPAEAAYLTMYPNSTLTWEEYERVYPTHDWRRVAKAAIDTHLAQVAEGLPSVKEIDSAFEGGPARNYGERVLGIFAERFAKLESENAKLKANYIADWIACEKILTSAGIDMDPTEYGGKTVETGIEDLKAAMDESKTILQKWTAEFATRGTLANIYIAEKDAAITDLNQRLIERTEGFMSRLAEKTKRERYVPIEEHEEMKRVAMEGLVSMANMPEYDQDDAHRLRNLAAQALTKLKGTEQ